MSIVSKRHSFVHFILIHTSASATSIDSCEAYMVPRIVVVLLKVRMVVQIQNILSAILRNSLDEW